MSETSDHFGANVVLFLYVPTLNKVFVFLSYSYLREHSLARHAQINEIIEQW